MKKKLSNVLLIAAVCSMLIAGCAAPRHGLPKPPKPPGAADR